MKKAHFRQWSNVERFYKIRWWKYCILVHRDSKQDYFLTYKTITITVSVRKMLSEHAFWTHTLRSRSAGTQRVPRLGEVPWRLEPHLCVHWSESNRLNAWTNDWKKKSPSDPFSWWRSRGLTAVTRIRTCSAETRGGLLRLPPDSSGSAAAASLSLSAQTGRWLGGGTSRHRASQAASFI